MLYLLFPIVCLGGAAPGCGDGDNDNGGTICPIVSGNWVVDEHCEPGMVGQVVSVVQDRCSLTADWGGPEAWTGAIGNNNAVTMSGTTGSTMLECSGTVIGASWTMDCTPGDCHVSLTPQ
jgi:hypothetical protein